MPKPKPKAKPKAKLELRPKETRRPTRPEAARVKVGVYVRPEVRNTLKYLAAVQSREMSEIAEEALSAHFKRLGVQLPKS